MSKLTKKQIQNLASKGRGGDTMLAHINPQEAALLKAHGGSGTINPDTGLPEFLMMVMPDGSSQHWMPKYEPGVSQKGPSFGSILGSTVGNIISAPQTAISSVSNVLAKADDKIINPVVAPVSNVAAKFDDATRKVVGSALTAPQKAYNSASNALAGFDDAANKAAKQLGSTVQAIADDPKKLALVAIAIYYPGAALEIGNTILGPTLATQYPFLASTVGQTVLNTAANGGDVESAAKSAIIQNGSTTIANQISKNIPAATSNVDKIVKDFAAKAATNVTVAQLTGKDPTAALVMGGAQAATNVILSEYGKDLGFDKLPDTAKRSVSAALTASLAGKDVTTAVTDSLIKSAITEGQNYIKAQNTVSKTGFPALTTEQLRILKDAPPENLEKALSDAKSNDVQISNVFLSDISAAKTSEELNSALTKADKSYTTKQEVLDAFRGTGYTPSDQEIDRYVGEKSERSQTQSIGLYTDIVQAFEKEQNKPSSSTELAKLAEIVSDPGVILRLPDGRVLIDTGRAKDYGEGPALPLIRVVADKADTDNLNIPDFEETQYDVLQAIQKSNPDVKVDELVTDAFDAMQEQGYTSSIDELIEIIKQSKEKTPEGVSKAAADYVDQKGINKDEVTQYLIDSGISKPTDEQINQFIKKGSEADIKNEIDAYANPIATTAAEAEQMLKDAGILNPTKEQIAMFTKEGAQTDTQTALNAYAKPFVTAEYLGPLEARIQELIKQGSDYQAAADKAIAELTQKNKELTSAFGTSKKSVTQADIDLMGQMVSGKSAGDARYDVTGDGKVTQEDIDYLSKYLGDGAGGAGNIFKPGADTYWAPTGLQGDLYKAQLSREAEAAKVAAANKAAAAKAAADKLAADKLAKLQQFKTNVMMSAGISSPVEEDSTVQPTKVVKAAPYFDIGKPLDIDFFDQQAEAKKDTQTQPGVVKIAQGGYMNALFPQEEASIDEILRILEGR